MLWSERNANHLFVFWRGQPIYKNYDDPAHPSWLLNQNGWPGSVLISPTEPAITKYGRQK